MRTLVCAGVVWPALTFGPVNLLCVVPAWRFEKAQPSSGATHEVTQSRGKASGVHPGVEQILAFR